MVGEIVYCVVGVCVCTTCGSFICVGLMCGFDTYIHGRGSFICVMSKRRVMRAPGGVLILFMCIIL